jgi:hypothetical protein
MDPYLESPVIWPDVHHELISQIRGALNPDLRPHYVARVDLRVYFSDDDDPGRAVHMSDLCVTVRRRRSRTRQPKGATALAVTEPLIVPTLVDEEIEEAFLKIVHVESKELVTVIEVLGPSNKVRGSSGRTSFMTKQREVLDSEVNWVEIDLLRAGVPSVTDPPLRSSDYRVLISSAQDRSRTRFWPIGVRQPLPVVTIPLRDDDEAALDLGAVFRAAYDRAAYDLSVEYRKAPVPPLGGDDAKWARELLRRQGAR